MAKVEVDIREAKALRELMQTSTASIPMGLILGTFMIKVERAFGVEQENALKEKFSPKKEKKIDKKEVEKKK